jgi:myosin V
VADQAFRDMQEHARSHSILVSGESGAGKTETCKLLMSYLAYIISQTGGGGGGGVNGLNGLNMGLPSGASPAPLGVELPDGEANGAAPGEKTLQDKVLESNPLLEAFGNAKTVRNDNSSRFGKFTEIQFRRVNPSGPPAASKGGKQQQQPRGGAASGGLPGGKGSRWEICGAAIRTYLLERSRVVSVTDPERNYHIFYQLCEGCSDAERAEFSLGAPADFFYLNQSSCTQLQGVSNADEYARTRRAMTVVGIPPDEQHECMRLLAAVLHLGNVQFRAKDGDAEASAVAPGAAEAALGTAAGLLGVAPAALAKALTTRTIQTPEGPTETPLRPPQAASNRDSLAKKLYSTLFDWLVARINVSLSAGGDVKPDSIIGILDIYGFEEFKYNDFEQLCINYANEKLQQHFNRHVFKMEQMVRGEGIEVHWNIGRGK